MFFDNYSGEHTGKLEKYWIQNGNVHLSFNISFPDTYNKSRDFSNLITQQYSSVLGQRLSKIGLEGYVGRMMRIQKNSRALYLFFLINDDSEELIGMISESERWTEEEDKQWFVNDDNHFTIDRQAHFFGRSKEDIEKRQKEKFDRQMIIRALELPNVERKITDFVSFKKPVLAYGAAIMGACYENEEGRFWGQAVFNGDNESKLVFTTEEETLFKLSIEEIRILYQKLLLDENNIIRINKVANELFINHPFFDKIFSETDKDEICLWIGFEELANKEFKSYYFAVSDNRNEDYLHKAAKNESRFLRYIMFLRSLLTSRLEKLNDRERENTRIQAVRSAIATIMSRNMSHNLGSHVLYYTQRDLLDIANKLSFDVTNHEAVENFRSKQYDMFLRGASFIVAFMKNRTNYIAALSEDTKFPSLPVAFESEIFNYLIIDEISAASLKNPKPIVNYYLKNIVRSEGFSREDYHPKQSSLQINLKKGNLSDEELRYLSLSFPGGVLSIQAFCNIFENFIRNSAKYWTGKEYKKEKLVFTIKLSVVDNNQLCVIIYDNKGDASVNINKLQEKLQGGITILNEDNSINKEDKGIKEMLLSYLWLCSNIYSESLSSFVYKLDHKKEAILDFVNKNLRYVAVDKNGGVVEKGSDLNLGLLFKLPLHYVVWEVTKKNVSSIQGVSMDVVSCTKKIVEEYSFIDIFPRIFIEDKIYSWEIDPLSVEEKATESRLMPTQKFYSSICEHFHVDVDQYKIWFGDYNEDRTCDYNKQIFFDTHLSNGKLSGEELFEYYNEFLYVDSISGANYTKTLEQILGDSLVESAGRFLLKTWRTKLLSLKIKESAITRITIIDERLYQEIKKWIDIRNHKKEQHIDYRSSQVELSLRNIRVLNWVEKRDGRLQVFDGKTYRPVEKNVKQVKEFPVLCGNDFRPIGPYKDKPNKTNFLSIHLGLIEKMLKDSTDLDDICGERGGMPLSNQRIERFIEAIKATFSPDFICIHSGRGGLSKELEDTCLNQYPFIPFVTLEYLFNDSKFLLSQMFYSLKYKQLPR